jgi:hypothetical protein
MAARVVRPRSFRTALPTALLLGSTAPPFLTARLSAGTVAPHGDRQHPKSFLSRYRDFAEDSTIRASHSA